MLIDSVPRGKDIDGNFVFRRTDRRGMVEPTRLPETTPC